MTASPSSATIADVARVAGVSRAAVSKVLRDAYGVSDSMRQRVEQAMSDLAYRPRVSARAMRGSTFTLGISIPSLDSTFFADVFGGVEDELVGSRYRTIMTTSMEEAHDHSDQIQNLIDRQVDGLIVIGAVLDAAVLEDIGRHLPVVVLGRSDPSEHYDTVSGDDQAGTALVMRHLLDAGHTRITHLTQFDPGYQLPGTSHLVRRTSYEALMRAAGLGPQISMINARFEETAAHIATAAYLNSHEIPSAIFAGADEAAFGVLHALADHEDDLARRVAVVGYDNTRFARHPRIDLTSVDQRGRELGRRAAAMILERLAGRTTAVHDVMEPRLIIRGSSTNAPYAAAPDGGEA